MATQDSALKPPSYDSHSYGSIEQQPSSSGHESGHLASNWDTFLSISCIILGTGILQLPVALKEGGWIGLIYIALAGILSNYTGILTVKALYTENGERLNTLADSGRAAFGEIGYTVTKEFKNYTLIAAGAIFILLAGINLDSLAVSLFELQPNIILWVSISGIFVLIPMWVYQEIHESPLMTFFGTFTSIFVIIIVIALSLKKRLSPDFEFPPTTVVRIYGFPVSFSSICFAFGGNLLWPEIEMGMKNRQSFNTVLSISNGVITLLYIGIAASAYSVFGDNVVSPVLLSFTSSFVLTLAYMLITAHVILTAPLLLIGVANDWAKDLSDRLYPNGGWSITHRNTLRGLIVLFSVTTVLLLPNFEKLVAFFSSLTSALLIFVLPVIFYIRLYSSRIKFGFWNYIWFYFILSVGALCFFVGSYLSGRELFYS